MQSHVVWMLVKPRIKPGPADIGDLRKNAVVQWQYRHYFAIALIWGIVAPAAVPGYFWSDWRGGYFYASFFRLVAVHHVRATPVLSAVELAEIKPCSQPSRSTLWLIGWAKAHSMTSIHQETTLSQHL